MFRRIAELILIMKWPLALAMILVTLLMGWAALRLPIDPSMETLFDKKSEEFQFYREYREKYGSDQMIAIAVASPDLFSLRNLKKLKRMTNEIVRFKQVERVLSLTNARDIQHKFMGAKIVPVLRKVFKGEEPVLEAKMKILANELYQGNLVARDGRVATVLVYLKPGGTDRKSQGQFIHELREYLAKLESRELRFYLAGSPIEQYDFIRLIRRDQFIFVPMITLLLMVTTFLMYRSFSCMLLSMAIVFMSLIWSMGTIALLGQELNLMTSLLAPVIMIVSVINSVYLINLFFEIRPHHASLRKCLVLTIDQLGVPCFLTHFVAILGFLSLAINPVPAIQGFGFFAALGTLYSYFIEIILTTILLPILPYRPSQGSWGEKHFFNRVIVNFLEKFDFRWKWWILVFTALGIAASVYGIKRVEVDTNMIKQMKPDLPLAISTRFIDEHLTGVYTLGFVIRRKGGGTFVDANTLRQVDEFKTFLESMPEISKVNSITTLIKKIHEAVEDDAEAYRIPEERERLERYFKEFKKSTDPELAKLLSPDFREIQLEARMRAVGTTRGARVEKEAREYLDTHLGKTLVYRITGNVVLLGKMAKNLVTEQLQSFGFAFLSILIAVFFFFRSIRLALIAAVPNLFPILAIYGIMGFTRIELSSPTAMISSIVLGLVVDASIQFLYRFRYEFSHRRHYLQALHHTYRNIGQSLVMSTFILMAGFASSVFAQFRPTVHFGVLTSLTIFLALLCTLLIVPVLVMILKPFGPQRLFKRSQG